jgi:hypothetical protein
MLNKKLKSNINHGDVKFSIRNNQVIKLNKDMREDKIDVS